MSAPVQDILNVPLQWPASFPRPKARTRVLTYVFDPKDAAKVQLLLDLIKTKFPGAKVAFVKDLKGFTSVSITQSLGSSLDLEATSDGFCNQSTYC